MLQEAEKAVEQNPKFADAHIVMGEALVEIGKEEPSST